MEFNSGFKGLIQGTYCVSLLKVRSFRHLRCVHILLHVAFLEVSLMIIFVIIYTTYMYNIYDIYMYNIYVLYIYNIRGVSGKYPAILNISRTGGVALV